MRLRCAILIREQHANGKEGPKVNLLPSCNKDSQQSGGDESGANDTALISNGDCICFAEGT
jgi:hypothetical protein